MSCLLQLSLSLEIHPEYQGFTFPHDSVVCKQILAHLSWQLIQRLSCGTMAGFKESTIFHSLHPVGSGCHLGHLEFPPESLTTKMLDWCFHRPVVSKNHEVNSRISEISGGGDLELELSPLFTFCCPKHITGPFRFQRRENRLHLSIMRQELLILKEPDTSYCSNTDKNLPHCHSRPSNASEMALWLHESRKNHYRKLSDLQKWKKFSGSKREDGGEI